MANNDEQSVLGDRIAQLQRELMETRASLAAVRENRVDSYRNPKIPTFFTNDPTLWFLQVESTFASCRITAEQTKADFVIANLDGDVINCVRDLLTAAERPDNIYTQIKERIISNFSVSAEARLRQLLKGQVSSSGKPSLILARLRALDSNCGEDILRTVFMDQLPPGMRSILAVSAVTDLKNLAELADKIAETSQFADSSVAAISPGNSSTLEAKIDLLTARLAALETIPKRNSQKQGFSRARNRSQSRNSRARFRSNSASGRCWYHQRYNNKARKCTKPCSWVTKPNDNSDASKSGN